MSSCADAPSAPSEKFPDHLPGFYIYRGAGPEYRVQAFHVRRNAGFPLDFLSTDERVERRGSGNALALLITKEGADVEGFVCEGEWLIRHPSGRLDVLGDEAFRRVYAFDHDFEKTVQEQLRSPSCPEERLAGGLRVVVEAINGHPGVSPDYRFVGIRNAFGEWVEFPWQVAGPDGKYFHIVIPDFEDHDEPEPGETPSFHELSAAARLSLQDCVEEQIADDDGWQGTEPADGTRRALISNALRAEDVLSETEVRELADAVEKALLTAESCEGGEEGRAIDGLDVLDAELKVRAEALHALMARVAEGNLETHELTAVVEKLR